MTSGNVDFELSISWVRARRVLYVKSSAIHIGHLQQRCPSYRPGNTYCKFKLYVYYLFFNLCMFLIFTFDCWTFKMFWTGKPSKLIIFSIFSYSKTTRIRQHLVMGGISSDINLRNDSIRNEAAFTIWRTIFMRQH